MQPFVIPFDGINYVCWRANKEAKHRPLNVDEERNYFQSENKEQFLYELLSRR